MLAVSSTAISVPPVPPPVHDSDGKLSTMSEVNSGSIADASKRVIFAMVAGAM
jgi:hypothetical protein